MGLCYEVGTGVEPDDERCSLGIYERLNKEMQMLSGTLVFIMVGFGVEDDEKKAFQWYMRLEQGNLTTQNSIGDCYANGVGKNR